MFRHCCYSESFISFYCSLVLFSFVGLHSGATCVSCSLLLCREIRHSSIVITDSNDVQRDKYQPIFLFLFLSPKVNKFELRTNVLIVAFVLKEPQTQTEKKLGVK